MVPQTIDKIEHRFEIRHGANGKKDLLLGQILLRDLSNDDLSALGAAVVELLGEPLSFGSGYETTCDNPKVRFMACVYDGEVAVLVQYGRYQQAFTIGEMNDLAALLKNELLNHSGEFGVGLLRLLYLVAIQDSGHLI